MQNDLQDIQRDDTDEQQDERGELREAEDHVQHCDHGDHGNGIGHLRTDVIDVVGALLMASVIYPIAYAPEAEKKKKYETSF